MGEHESEEIREDGLFEEYEAMLEEYERKERRRRLVGPLISVAVHVAAAFIAAMLIVPQFEEEDQEVEISAIQEEFKEIEPETQKELKELEKKAEEVVPEVDKPEVSKEPTEDTAQTDTMNKPQASADTSIDTASMTDVKVRETGMEVSNLFGGRSEGGREDALDEYGGSKETEEAVLAALRWLKKTQKDDGSWGEYEGRQCNNSVPMSSFALLAFLAHGETPAKSDEFGKTVRMAMKYLTDHMMNKEKVHKKSQGYVNGIETYALAEAYGMTQLPFLKAPARRGLKMIIEGQQKNGGWNYGYDPSNHADEGESRWDLSVAGWQMQALKAGYVAGIKIPGMGRAIKKSITFCKEVAYKNGGFGYSSPGFSGWAMQGAGLLALQLLGEKNSREVRRGLDKVKEKMPFEWEELKQGEDKEEQGLEPEGWPVYAWYYLTQAMFHGGRATWNKWNRVYPETIVARQKSDGHWELPAKIKGSHHRLGPWYTTSLLALTLQVYYRYLPTYEMPEKLAIKKDGEEDKSSLDVDSSDTEGLDIDVQ